MLPNPESQTFIFGATALAAQHILLGSFGGREQVSAVGAEHHGPNGSHFPRQFASAETL
jgi:hypothetical protein